jgi:RimJ/RimL family protein N-acetyltransferase
LSDRVLVDYRAVHDADTVRWLSSADLRATFGFSGDISVESHRRWVETARDTHLWAIVAGAGLHCGNTLVHVNPRHRSGYLQMYIGEPAARGRGLGDAALRETLSKAFQDLGLHRVWLHTLPGNLAAQALYRKHGFTSEGVERESILACGRFISQDRWSILADEWRAASRASPT